MSLPSSNPDKHPQCFGHFGQYEHVQGDCDTCFWGHSCFKEPMGTRAFYRNKRNGKLYASWGVVSDVTNGRGLVRMVLYMDKFGIAYIRDHDEFMEKFEPADE